MRAPGMGMEKLPLFVWSVFITAWQLLLSQPVLAGMISATLDTLHYSYAWEQSKENLTICWKILFATKVEIGQSAVVEWIQRILENWTPKGDNPSQLISSYETFDKGILREFTSEQIIASFLPSYFTGLYEGDGYIYVPKKDRTEKGKKLYANQQLVFHKKDFPLALCLSTIFTKSSLILKSQKLAYIQTITSKDNLRMCFYLLNGNIRTKSKYLQFQNLYNYQIKNNILDKNIKLLPVNNTPFGDINKNHWLSGFIEANGSFHIRTTKTNRIRIGFDFSICQVKERKEVIEQIAKFLEVNIGIIEAKNQVRVRTSSFLAVAKIINYLENHPIYGSKWNDFLDFKKGYNIYRLNTPSGDNKTLEELRMELQEIKKNMNNHRTLFFWEHLINLQEEIQNLQKIYKINSDLS